MFFVFHHISITVLLFLFYNYSNFYAKLANMTFVRNRFIIALLLLISLFFIYLNFTYFPYLLSLYSRVDVAEAKYKEAVGAKNAELDKSYEAVSVEAKARYEKEFFNKTIEGETLVILHKTDSGKFKEAEEKNQLNFIDRNLQTLKLWWKNL
jgi:hypothetical protein